ncbi:hypothetical protein RRSWK_03951 [Rhodopirellula sp. SWK7]|nr:hypothetical protein RRSWK_03951 [Rhodopirellula sp. SWK7]
MPGSASIGTRGAVKVIERLRVGFGVGESLQRQSRRGVDLA